MAKSALVHDYCDAVEVSRDAHPVQRADALGALSEFSSAADLYGYTVCPYDVSGRPLETSAPASNAHWIVFDNVYARTSGGRSPQNADRARAHRAGFLAKGGIRNPERAAALWEGVRQTFGDPAGASAGPPREPIRTAALTEREPVPAAKPVVQAESSQESAEWAGGLVRDVGAYWSSLEGRSRLWASGFAVFYSPVVEPVHLVIVGDNPGGGPESFDAARATTVPIDHEYFVYDYPMARRMRSLFEGAGKLDLLRKSVKTNLNFFRSRSAEEWASVAPAARVEMEAFSLDRVREILARLNPRFIVAEGFRAFDVLEQSGSWRPGLRSDLRTGAGQRLYATRRNAAGTTLIGLRHPTGARTSAADLARVTQRLAVDLA